MWGDEILTASDLNSEVNNILNNALSLISPLTGSLDWDGFSHTLDAAAATTVQSTAAIAWNFTPGAKTGTPGTTGSIQNWAASTTTDNNTAASGTATAWTGHSLQRPTLAATNTGVTTTDAATAYIANSPAAGTNETITNAWALWVDDGNVRLDGNLQVRGTGPHSIGGSTVSTIQVGVIGSFTGNNVLAINSTLSPAAGTSADAFSVAGVTIVEAGSGLHDRLSFVRIGGAVTAGAGTVTDLIGLNVASFTAQSGTTNASGIKIDGAPSGATNNYALWVDAGTTRLDGAVLLETVAPATPVANTVYTDSIVKGWVRFNGTGVIAIDDDLNVTSLTDNGTGDYTITWATAFASANYSISGVVLGTSFLSRESATNLTTTAARVTVFDSAGAAADAAFVSVIAIGDQ